MSPSEKNVHVQYYVYVYVLLSLSGQAGVLPVCGGVGEDGYLYSPRVKNNPELAYQIHYHF